MLLHDSCRHTIRNRQNYCVRHEKVCHWFIQNPVGFVYFISSGLSFNAVFHLLSYGRKVAMSESFFYKSTIAEVVFNPILGITNKIYILMK